MSQIFMEMILKILGTIFYCFYLNLIIYIIYTQQNLKLMLFNQKMQSIFNIKSEKRVIDDKIYEIKNRIKLLEN